MSINVELYWPMLIFYIYNVPYVFGSCTVLILAPNSCICNVKMNKILFAAFHMCAH